MRNKSECKLKREYLLSPSVDRTCRPVSLFQCMCNSAGSFTLVLSLIATLSSANSCHNNSILRVSYGHINGPNTSEALHLLNACTHSLCEAGTGTMRAGHPRLPAMATVIDHHVLYRDIIRRGNDHTWHARSNARRCVRPGELRS